MPYFVLQSNLENRDVTPTEAIEEVAKIVGSKAEIARLLEVKAPTVSQWCSGDRPIPPKRAIELERLSGGKVSRVMLCPGFPWHQMAS